jgi:(E)-4-hydroxy-3-methylbut-2-enyl-diphosphate synthase
MGCVVNGPGEAREADLGLAAGRGRGHLFIKGEVVRVVPEADMVDALIEEAKLLVEQGIEARIAAGDVNAADIAEETRLELMSIQGDVNATAARRQAVQDVIDAEGSN